MSFVELSETHVPTSSEAFLDTSIHCCLLKGTSRRQRLTRFLSLFSWKGSSSYSKVEYGNVILTTAQYLLRELRKRGNVAELEEHIHHDLPDYHHKYRTWSFSLIKTLGTTESDRTRRTDAYLRRLLKQGTMIIDLQCDYPLADGTKCHWGKTGLKQRSDGEYVWKAPNCKRSKKACDIDNFFNEHRETFQDIKNEIDVLPKKLLTDELIQFSRIIGEALKDSSILLDYREGCRLIADVIIAVDSKGYSNFVTQNYKESQILTKLLGQRCYYVPNDPKHEIQMLDHGEVPPKSE
jgi:hypothetical protein